MIPIEIGSPSNQSRRLVSFPLDFIKFRRTWAGTNRRTRSPCFEDLEGGAIFQGGRGRGRAPPTKSRMGFSSPAPESNSSLPLSHCLLSAFLQIPRISGNRAFSVRSLLSSKSTSAASKKVSNSPSAWRLDANSRTPMTSGSLQRYLIPHGSEGSGVELHGPRPLHGPSHRPPSDAGGVGGDG